MNRLKEIALAQKINLLFLIVIATGVGVAIILQAYFLVSAVDSVFLKGATMTEVLPLLGGLLLIFFLRTLFDFVKGKIGIKMATAAKRTFRQELMNRYQSDPVHVHKQTGEKVSVMMDTVDAVDSYFSSYVPQVIKTSLIPILLLIVVFTQHINSGLVLLITAPFFPIFMIVIGIKTQAKSEEQLKEMAVLSGGFLDALQGLTTLKLLGKSHRKKESIEMSSLGFRDKTMEILKITFTQSFMLEVITMLSIGIVALELAIQLIIYQSISFFTAFFVLLLVPEFFTSLRELGTTFHNGRTSMGAAKQLEEEFTQNTDVPRWGQLPVPKDPIIQLENVSFHYGKDQFSLTDIEATILPKQEVAIVGQSGSGKSTLLHVMAGLLSPHEGEIYLNGQALMNHDEKDWYQNLAYITQHPFIFSGSIANNIAIGGREKASLDEIKSAAKQAGIHEMISGLEKGYETLVGEGGRGLSGGEKQRIALARAFLKKPSIILFDEPTTGLDLQTEAILQQSIQQLKKGAIIITVAHRLHTIKRADQLLFLDNGSLVATGTHEELMEQVPQYSEMVSIQRGTSK